MKKPYRPPKLTELGRIKKCRRCGKYRMIPARKRLCEKCREAKPPNQWHNRRPGRKPNRGKDWPKIRRENLDFCEICGTTERHQAANIHRDHILPARLIQLYAWGDPNARENLICICNSDHGSKKQVEDKLFEGDWLGFVQGLNALGWPMERVKRAFAFYGLQLGGGQLSIPSKTQSSGIAT